MSAEQVIKVIGKIEKRFEDIKSYALSSQDEVNKLEDLWIECEKNMLYSNHYLLVDISLRIVNKEGLRIYCLKDMELERFLFHCNAFLKVANVLSPGYTRARALVLFFLSQALMIKARKLLSKYNNTSGEKIGIFKHCTVLNNNILCKNCIYRSKRAEAASRVNILANLQITKGSISIFFN